MTLTAAPHTSVAIDNAAFGDFSLTGENSLTTTDHRKVGGLLAAASLLVGVVGVAVLGLVTWRLDDSVRGTLPGSGFLGASFEGGWSFTRLWTAVENGLPFFVVAPLFLALSTIAVPRLIGSTRMAFPRVQAFVLWGYVAAVALFIAAFTVVDGPPLWTTAFRPGDTQPSNHATDLLSAALGVLSIVLFAGAVNVVATVLTQRRPGLRLDDIAPFAWASLLASAVTALSMPVFAGGLLMWTLNAHVGGNLSSAPGFDRVWQHTVYLYGRPDTFMLVLPALGVASQIVSNRVGKPLIGGIASKVLMAMFAAFSFGVWATANTSAMVQPTSSLVSGLVAIPTGLLVLIWLGTIAQGMKPDTSVLAVVGLIVMLALGALNVIVAGVRGVNGDLKASWTIGQTLLLLVAAPIAAAIGGFHEFAPLVWGRRTMAPLGGLAGLAALAGGVLLGGGIAGVAYKDTAADKATVASAAAGIGAFLLAGALALTILNLLGSVVARRGAEVDQLSGPPSDPAPDPSTGAALEGAH